MKPLSNQMLGLGVAGATLVIMAATTPLAAVIGWSGLANAGFAARGVSGSLWSGTATGATMRGLPLGDLALATSPLPLIAGRIELDVRPATEGLTGPSGRIVVTRAGYGLADFAWTAPAGAVVGVASGGDISLSDFNVRFADGRCASVEGEVGASIALGDGAGSNRVLMSGTPACADGVLLLPLAGRTPAGDASLDVRIDAGGGVRYDIVLDADAALAARLAPLGFTAYGNRLRLAGTTAF